MTTPRTVRLRKPFTLTGKEPRRRFERGEVVRVDSVGEGGALWNRTAQGYFELQPGEWEEVSE